MSIVSMNALYLAMGAAALYYLVPKRWQWVVLLLFSLAFYAFAGAMGLVVALTQVAVSYLTARALFAVRGNKRRARQLVALGVGLNLLSLVGLKYSGMILSTFGLTPHLEWVLPLGISYYTLSSVGYTIDVYRGECPPERNPLKLALFVLYFPHVSMGPIARYGQMQGRLIEGHDFQFPLIGEGLSLALWGLFKKLVIADNLARIVDAAYGPMSLYGGTNMIIATVLFAIQLYADFSGCMDIVGGASLFFGIRLEKNFNHPYFSRTIPELWRRWHITLGAWLRDYVFFPVSRTKLNRRIGKWGRAHLNYEGARYVVTLLPVAIVWLLTGLWHGAEWKFVLWGAFQGALLVGGMAIEPYCARMREKLHLDGRLWYGVLQMLRTFGLCCIGRVIFRAASLKDVGTILKNCASAILHPDLSAVRDAVLNARELMGNSSINLLMVAGACGVLLLVSILEERGRAAPWSPKNTAARWIVSYALLFYVLLFGNFGVGATSFLYMQF